MEDTSGVIHWWVVSSIMAYVHVGDAPLRLVVVSM